MPSLNWTLSAKNNKHKLLVTLVEDKRTFWDVHSNFHSEMIHTTTFFLNKLKIYQTLNVLIKLLFLHNMPGSHFCAIPPIMSVSLYNVSSKRQYQGIRMNETTHGGNTKKPNNQKGILS